MRLDRGAAAAPDRMRPLVSLVQALRQEGCNVLEKTDDSEYGEVRLGHRPRGQQGRTRATACRSMSHLR